MKLAIIGSDSLSVENLEEYLPTDITEIISGRPNAIGHTVADYAKSHNIHLTEIFPDYPKHRCGASLVSDAQIADYADMGLFFWDGESRWTKYAYMLFQYRKKEIIIICKYRCNIISAVFC